MDFVGFGFRDFVGLGFRVLGGILLSGLCQESLLLECGNFANPHARGYRPNEVDGLGRRPAQFLVA